MESDKNQEKSFDKNRQKGSKMNRNEILEEYKNQEQRLLAAKILDKLEFTKTKNKIQSTDFLNLNEQELAMKLLKKVDCENYYPEKITEEMSRKNDDKIISIIRIKLPNELEGGYDHRTYLGSCIKIGIEREKIGDILVERTGADIIAKTEVIDFLYQNKTLQV